MIGFRSSGSGSGGNRTERGLLTFLLCVSEYTRVVRSLLQPGVLKSSGAAALVTSLVCLPRLALWRDRPHPLWLLSLTLAWASFILWSFVFAWRPQIAQRSTLAVKTSPAAWSVATLAGLAGAVILRLIIDPVLRPLMPGDYPDTHAVWLAMTLFGLAFDQLFLCFAPFAFFVRLSQNQRAAAGLTVLFGVALLGLRIQSLALPVSPFFIAELFVWRTAAGLLTLYFYLKGGALLAWWWVLLMQLRHLIALSVPA